MTTIAPRPPKHATARLVAGSALALILSACAGQPFEYRSQTEIPAGPGLLSGELGEIVIVAPGGRRAAMPEPSVNHAEFEDYREFKRFKQAHAPEYRQFQEWRQYKLYRTCFAWGD